MLLSTNSFKKVAINEKEPHHLLVDFNQDYLFTGPDRSFFKANCGLPYPVGPPLSVPWDLQSPLGEMLKEGATYEEAINDAHQKNLLQKVEDRHFQDSKYKYVPLKLLEMYQAEKGSDGGYLGRGVLDVVKVSGVNYLVWPTFEGNIRLMNIENLAENYQFSVSLKSLIYSLRTYNFTSEYSYILLQHKSSVTLFKICRLPDLVSAFSINFEKHILDAKLHKGDLGLIFKDENQFCIKNIQSKKTIFQHFSKLTHSMVQFDFYKENQVLIMNQFVLQIFDYQSETLLQTFDPKLTSCNQLCSFIIMDDSIILVSQHYLIKTEFSRLENFKTFSHTMNFSPLLIDAVFHQEEYFLCLGSYQEQTKILFSGKVLFALPCVVPGIKSTLNEAVLKYPHLVGKQKLEERLNYFIVGMKFVAQEHNLYLYSVNDIGELFCQEITYKSLHDSHAVNQFCSWVSKLSEPKVPLYITHFVQLGHIFLNLRKPDNSKLHSVVERQEKNCSRFLQKFEPIYNKSNIKSTFGQGFLDIWDESSHSEDGEEEVLDRDQEEVPFYEKVNSWMVRNDEVTSDTPD